MKPNLCGLVAQVLLLVWEMKP